MTISKSREASLGLAVMLVAILQLMTIGDVHSDEIDPKVAFPEKFMIRVSSYRIDSADTKVTVLNDIGIGVGYSFSRDFNTEDDATVPRVDMYYRFNEHHRIDFSWFSTDRKGERDLNLEIEIGDIIFSRGETLKSRVQYDLYRIGYSYSFYHSETVELAISTGLNVTQYDIEFSNSSGSSVEDADATAPLPMFGLQMGYAFNDSWSVHYLMETFFIEIDDTYKGTFFNNEISVQYRFFDNFMLSLGLTRVGVDLEVDKNDWKGDVEDSYDGYLLSAGYFF